jgi:dipeptidyl aminopeptidase/acylaminoacyl peptidase
MIVLVHGFSSNKYTANFLKLKDILNSKGISSFRFDVWGHGESEGRFEEITITEAVDNILQAIKFLKSLGYWKIGLVGSSFGGIASIVTVSRRSDIFLLALKSPVSNYEEKEITTKSKEELKNWRKTGFRYYESGDGRKLKLNYSFYEDFKNNDGYKAAHNIKAPTIIVHGDADESVPVSQSIKISKLIPDCRLVLIKGANHRYTERSHTQQMLKAISDFIIENSK